MRLPDNIAKSILAGRSLGFTCTADHKVIEGFEKGWGGGGSSAQVGSSANVLGETPMALLSQFHVLLPLGRCTT